MLLYVNYNEASYEERDNCTIVVLYLSISLHTLTQLVFPGGRRRVGPGDVPFTNTDVCC